MAFIDNKTEKTEIGRALEDFPKSLQESINRIIEQEGYVKHRVEKKTVQQSGNFLSILYEVNIIGETVDSDKVTSLFIKKSITLDRIKLAKVSDVYSRELFIYNDVSKIFAELQVDAGVPVKEKFRFLKSFVSDNDAIVMENLSKQGFQTYSSTQVAPIRFAELSIINLAKFHAMSYVVKKRNPKYFNQNIKVIKHAFYFDSDWEGFMHNVCDVTVQVVKDEAKTKIKNNAPRMLQTYKKYIKDIVPANGCLCHGDYKVPNILVKEVDGDPAEVQPIDYQLMYYGNPVDDFLFFIFSNTDQEFRREHLTYLKDLYFKNFAKFLKYFNIDVNSTYSREEFENDYEERLELGLVFGLYMAAFTFAHVDEGFDVSKLSLSELPIIPDEMFADRVRGIVEDYIDWGYL